MMDMLKAYAHQVVSYHPAAQRDDLFAEIYDELCESFSDAKEENPSLSETDFLDRNMEHPMKFATRLAGSESAYLIGPQFYFSFISSLKVAVSIVLAFHFVLGAVMAFLLGQGWSALWNTLASIPESLLWVCASVLGVFIALEKSGEKATWLDKWQASDLEAVDDHQSISKGEVIFDLVFSSFALLLILDVIQFPSMIRHDGEWISDWSVNLPDSFWWLAGLLLAFDIVFAVYRLTRNLWSRKLRLTTIVMQVFWLAILLYAIVQPDLLNVQNAEVEPFLPIIDKTVRGTLLIIMLVVAWDTLSHVWRLLKRP